MDLTLTERTPPQEGLLLVEIERFQGPLDLLLHLIRTQDVDVFDIPVSKITQQFLKAIEGLGAGDLDVAGEFLEMAATLIRIKAQMLLPPVLAGISSIFDTAWPECPAANAEFDISMADIKMRLNNLCMMVAPANDNWSCAPAIQPEPLFRLILPKRVHLCNFRVPPHPISRTFKICRDMAGLTGWQLGQWRL